MGILIGVSSAGINHGDSVSITGTNFGTKSPAAPEIYDDFSGGTDGNKINQSAASHVGTWETGTGDSEPEYDTAQFRVGGMSSLHPFRDDTPGPAVFNASLAQNGAWDTIFFSFWTRVSHFGLRSRNYKGWRIFTAASAEMGDRVFWCDDAAGAGFVSLGSWGNWWNTTDSPGFDLETDYLENTWWQEKGCYRRNAGGIAQYWFNNRPHPENSINTNPGANQVGQIRFGHFHDWEADGNCAQSSGADIWVDQLYFDITPARIEIGDANTYAGSTIVETQIPTAWSDTAATFTANVAGFPPNTPAWIYLFDSNSVQQHSEAVTVNPT